MAGEGSGAARRDGLRVIRAALCGLALAGCAGQPRETFDLSGPSGASGGAPARGDVALAVSEPIAVAPTSSDRVVVRDADGSVAVLPGVQWSERLPRLFQDRLIEALQRAGVSASRFNAAAATTLAIDIRRFEIDISRNLAIVDVAARLVSAGSGATRAAKAFHAEAPAPEHTGAPGVHALTTVSAEAASRIAAWARAQL